VKVSAAGICALARHEGIVPAPYLDSVGVWTWGVGHTAAAGAPDPGSMPRGMPEDLEAAIAAAVRQFALDLERYEAEVTRALRVEVAQHEFDALVSWHYNTGAVRRATLTRELNAGRRDQAALEFMRWTKQPELIGRRKEEQALFRGVYPSGSVPVWRVSKAGRIDWRKPVRMVSQAELLALMVRPSAAPAAPAAAGPAAVLNPSPVAAAPAPPIGPAPQGWVQSITAALRGLFQRRA
jgi:lysozyme